MSPICVSNKELSRRMKHSRKVAPKWEKRNARKVVIGKAEETTWRI
jgi:hypothetical protein